MLKQARASTPATHGLSQADSRSVAATAGTYSNLVVPDLVFHAEAAVKVNGADDLSCADQLNL